LNFYLDLNEAYDKIKSNVTGKYGVVTDQLLDQIASEAFMYIRLRMSYRFAHADISVEIIDAILSDFTRAENMLFDLMLVEFHSQLEDYKIDVKNISNHILRNRRVHIFTR
jgi:hypothetical protein